MKSSSECLPSQLQEKVSSPLSKDYVSPLNPNIIDPFQIELSENKDLGAPQTEFTIPKN